MPHLLLLTIQVVIAINANLLARCFCYFFIASTVVIKTSIAVISFFFIVVKVANGAGNMDVVCNIAIPTADEVSVLFHKDLNNSGSRAR